MEKLLYKIYGGITNKIKPICLSSGYFSSPEEANIAAMREAIEFYKAKARITPGLKNVDDIERECFTFESRLISSGEEVKRRYHDYILNNVEYYAREWQTYKIYIGIVDTIAPQCVYIGDYKICPEIEARTVAKKKAIELYQAISGILPSVATKDIDQAIIYYVMPWMLDVKFELHEDSSDEPIDFKIDGIKADIEDFGDSRKGADDVIFFTKKPPTKEILVKYKITPREYKEICIMLKSKLGLKFRLVYS